MDDFEFETDDVHDEGSTDPREQARIRTWDAITHLLEIDRHDDASHRLRALLAEDPGDVDALETLAYVTFVQGDPDEALRIARQALTLDAERVGVLRVAAQSHGALGQNTSAERMLLDGLGLEPMSSELLTDYAFLTFKVGQLDKAKRLCERALECSPDETRAHALLSLIATERGSGREAHGHGDRALGDRPDAVGTHVVKGWANLQSGRPFAARRHIRAALQIDPTDDEVREMLVDADRCCRVPYLPAYYFHLLVDRVPGGVFALWGAFVVAMALLAGLSAPPVLTAIVVFGYVGLCIYTWVAGPITAIWMRIVPTK